MKIMILPMVFVSALVANSAFSYSATVTNNLPQYPDSIAPPTFKVFSTSEGGIMKTGKELSNYYGPDKANYQYDTSTDYRNAPAGRKFGYSIYLKMINGKTHTFNCAFTTPNTYISTMHIKTSQLKQGACQQIMTRPSDTPDPVKPH